MFAFFGLGVQEILVLGIVGVLVVGIPLAVILTVTRMSGTSSAREKALEEENQRLRDELDRGGRPPS